MTSRTWLRLALVAVTVACAWLTSSRLRVSTDVAALLPGRGDAAALAAWSRAFGGADNWGGLVDGGGERVRLVEIAVEVAEEGEGFAFGGARREPGDEWRDLVGE